MIDGPRKAIVGPFVPLMCSPDPVDRVQRAGENLRYDSAIGLFGEQGVINLFGIIGYYTPLSVMMNGARTEVPASTAPPLN